MIHEPTFIHPSVKIGEGTVVWHLATILEGTEIGENCVIGSSVWIGRGAKIGNNVRINDKCHITNEIEIGDNVFLGPGVMTADDKRPRVGNKDYVRTPPIIEDDASIGIGAILNPGVRVGAGAMVGAGAVITRDVEPGRTVTGIPAKPLTPRYQGLPPMDWLEGRA